MSKIALCLALLTGAADDIDLKQSSLLYPAVRVRTASAGGSGTVVYSEDRAEKGTFRTYVLTNHHVVDDAIRVVKRWDNYLQKEVSEEKNEQVDVELFSWHGGTIVDRKVIRGEIVAHSAADDLALLELKYNDRSYPLKVEHAARLAPKPVAAKLRVFQPIYAVGCSLGHDPIHSHGEITDLLDYINGKAYMMGSAPVIFGNSGGAVYAQVDGQYYVIGVPAAGGSTGYQLVSHMHWFVPAERVHAFLESQKLTFLSDPSVSPEACFEARAGERQKEKK